MPGRRGLKCASLPEGCVHEYFMRMALAEADAALAEGEVPVGAVIVQQNG